MASGRKDVAKAVNDVEIPESPLQARRALNTTPNTSCSLSPSTVFSKRKRSYSQTSKPVSPESSPSDVQLPANAQSGEELSKTLRRSVHRYTRDEVIDTSLESIQWGPPKRNAKKYECVIKLVKNVPVVLCLVIIVLVLIGILYILFYHVRGSTCPNASRNLVEQLATYFPTQPNRLWAQLRTALDSGCSKRDDSHAETVVRSPVVILLVHGRSRTIRTKHSDALFHRFVTCVGNFAAKRFPDDNHNQCLVFTDLTGDERRSAHEAEQLKLSIDAKLKSSYASGVRCFHFSSIDLLPPKTVVLFHGMADSQNSDYKEATLLFSLAHTFEFNDDDTLGILDSATMYRSFERHVQRYLRSIWEYELGNDAVSALLSRLTPTIGVFYTNQTELEVKIPIC